MNAAGANMRDADMRFRIASAICRGHGWHPDEPSSDDYKAADLVLKAMRTPTDEMIEKGAGRGHPRAVWEHMIDAATRDIEVMNDIWLRFWFEIVMRTHAGEFKDWDRERLGEWIRHNLADMGCETEPMGSAWAVIVKRRRPFPSPPDKDYRI